MEGSRIFYDEEGVDKLHGFIRDLSRRKRQRSLGMNSVFKACIDAGVLESHKVKAPRVDFGSLAKEALGNDCRSKFGCPHRPTLWL